VNVQNIFKIKKNNSNSSDSENSIEEVIPRKQVNKENKLRKYKSEEIPKVKSKKKKKMKPKIFYSKNSLSKLNRNQTRKKENFKNIKLEPLYKKKTSITCSLQGIINRSPQRS
jgi:hypothetical protein